MGKDSLKKALWEHPWAHQGLKCKTCLPIDAVEDLIDEHIEE